MGKEFGMSMGQVLEMLQDTSAFGFDTLSLKADY
jgi:hypothetical protein